MKHFLHQEIEGNKFELTIDSKIFSKVEALKAAYNFLDKGYFLFYTDSKTWDILVQCTKKPDCKETADMLLLEFSDELLSVHLRCLLEQENKVIRETIVWVALTSSLDTKNYIQQIPEPQSWQEANFETDIQTILKEIENDPDLKIDEAQIQEILKEIEKETEVVSPPKLTLNPEAVKKIKTQFSK